MSFIFTFKFSTKCKKEKAHDESIWSCAWGQMKVLKEKERPEDEEQEKGDGDR